MSGRVQGAMNVSRGSWIVDRETHGQPESSRYILFKVGAESNLGDFLLGGCKGTIAGSRQVEGEISICIICYGGAMGFSSLDGRSCL